jgi:hypothetical protein
MSCAGKGYGTNPQSNSYLSSHFFLSMVNTSVTPKTTRNCRRYNKEIYPSFTPIINGLSVISSSSGIYSLVFVNGSNFLPNGTTFIQFGNYGYLPVTYYSSFYISFVVPLNAVAGNYNVQVINLYNGNLSPQVNQSYSGNLNYSNSITYTIS